MTPVTEQGPLAAMELAARVPRLRSRSAEAGVDILVVSDLTNIRYLSGFTGSAGLLVVLPAGAVLVTDGRYGVQACEQTAEAGAEVAVEVAPAVRHGDVVAGVVRAAAVRGAAPSHLGLEAAHVSWATQRTWAESWFPGVDLLPTLGLVEGLRRVKDGGEVDRLARAAAIADSAFGGLAPLLEESPSEAVVAAELDHEMRRLGACGPSFETIVAAGPNAAMPHHRPGERRILPGETVVIDFGARFEGYCSDMTRTVWTGELVEEDLVRAVRVVGASQAAGVAALRGGVATAGVDQVCREVIAGAGWAERFVHGTGHGVGLDIHEAPSVAATSTDTLGPGYVVTVEPGVYLPGLGGVRIEDTLLVTEGGAVALTTTPKDLCA